MTRHVGTVHNMYVTHPKLLAEFVRLACKDLKPFKDEFDTIVVRGFSSTIPGGAIAVRMKKGVLVSRKEGVESYSQNLIEGMHAGRCVFVDDLFCTGKTLGKVVSDVQSTGGKLVGLWLYTGGVDQNWLEQWHPGLKLLSNHKDSRPVLKKVMKERYG